MTAKKKSTYFAKESAEAEEKRKQDEIRRNKELSELRGILTTKSGRGVIWRILAKGRAFDGSFEPDTNLHYFKSGQRNMALDLLNDVLAASPDNYHLMRNENGGPK